MQRLIDREVERAADLFEAAITEQVEAAARFVAKGERIGDIGSVGESYRQAWTPAALLFAGEVYNAIDRARKDFDEEQASVWEKALEEHIREKGATQITLIDGYSKEWVESTVRAILADAEIVEAGTDAIAKALRDRWAELSRNRALRIAQTEMNSAANYGSYIAAKAAGMTRKQWITAGDTRVRPGSKPSRRGNTANHRRLEGEIVGIDEVFSNQLFLPSFTGGPPEEVINCRCQVGYLP